MTGARILLAAARQLKRTGGKYGLVTLCIGVGQGYAAVIENAQREPMLYAFRNMVPVVHPTAFVHPQATIGQ